MATKPKDDPGKARASVSHLRTATLTGASVQATEYKPALPSWLVPGWFPASEVSLLVGHDGVGKSTLACHLAGLWTRGAYGRRERVHLSLVEDDRVVATIPRLIAERAVMSRISFPRAEDGWLFPRDLDYFRAWVQEWHPTVVVFDPLDQHVENVGQQVARRTLGVLAGMAHEFEFALLLVHHFTKTGKTVDQAIGGGRGVKGVARSITILGVPPDAGDYGADVLVLAHHKSSYGQREPAVMYEREHVRHPADPGGRIARLVEIGQTDHTPNDLLAVTGSRGWRKATARDLILGQLQDGPVSADQLEQDVRGLGGITRATYVRARTQLSQARAIETYQQRRKWWWRLVVAEPTTQTEQDKAS